MTEATAPAVIRTAIVEDMRDVREGLATLINFTEGFSLTGAYRSMEEAIPKIKGNVPDVLLSDIGLPGMDGFGVAAALRQSPRTARARLIAVTGYGQEEDRRRALEAGFDVHLVKPVDPEKLLRHLGS